MERQLVQETEDSVLQKGDEVGFGCCRRAQPLPRRNKVLALTTASLSPSPHATADSLSPSLCTTAASLSPRPHHMPLLPHARPHHCCLTIVASLCIVPLLLRHFVLSHYCCVTLYCLTTAVSLPLSHYRCLAITVSLPLPHYRCLTTAVSLAVSHYRCLTIAASVCIDLLPLSHCLLPAATAKKPRSTTTPSTSPHTCR